LKQNDRVFFITFGLLCD